MLFRVVSVEFQSNVSKFLISAITKLRSPFNFHRCPSPLFTVRFRCPTLQNSQCQPCLRKYHRQFSSSQPKYISYVAGIGITLAKQLEKTACFPLACWLAFVGFFGTGQNADTCAKETISQSNNWTRCRCPNSASVMLLQHLAHLAFTHTHTHPWTCPHSL